MRREMQISGNPVTIAPGSDSLDHVNKIMANEEHLKILKQGVEVWNKWREDNPDIRPDLIGGDLTGGNLVGANLTEADFTRANLTGADLSYANLRDADLNGANLSRAYLGGVVLWGANLSGANLRRANLSGANLRSATLMRANLMDAVVCFTSFGNIDLSLTNGLDNVRHNGPSTIGIDTLYKSGGKIPVEFLRGCGVPEEFITHIPSLIGALEPIQFYSCFISYSTKDDEFARRLHSRMREANLRVWFAPEEMKGGEKVHEQVERAIQLHDRLLVVLSEESMKSNWVINEIRNARRVELREYRRKLFPIGLTSFDRVKDWKLIDPDTGEDLALELRSYYIPDFSNWKDHDAFEREFDRLLRDLRAEEK